MTLIKYLLGKVVNYFSENNETIKVLFIVSNEIGFKNQLGIMRAMATDPRFEVKACEGYAEKLKFTVPEIESEYQKFEISTATATKRKWHYVFVTCRTHVWFRWDAIFITLSHGASVGNLNKKKKIWRFVMYEDNQANINLMNGIGYYHHIKSMQPDLLKDPNSAYFLTGAPCNNLSIDGQSIKFNSGDLPGLNQNRFVVLITSHWSEHSILRRNGLELLSKLKAEFPDYLFLVTAHPKLWTIAESSFNGMLMEKKITAFCQENKSFSFIKTGMPAALFGVADMLICDYSSIRVEFSKHKKPAVLYLDPEFQFQSNVTATLYKKSSFVFTSLDDVDNAINQAVNNAASRHNYSDLMYRYFFHEAEDPALKIKNILLKVGPIGSIHSAKWKYLKTLELEEKHMYDMSLAEILNEFPDMNNFD
jgi:hypothetical protein